jgi:hypothetical protein
MCQKHRPVPPLLRGAGLCRVFSWVPVSDLPFAPLCELLCGRGGWLLLFCARASRKAFRMHVFVSALGKVLHAAVSFLEHEAPGPRCCRVQILSMDFLRCSEFQGPAWPMFIGHGWRSRWADELQLEKIGRTSYLIISSAKASEWNSSTVCYGIYAAYIQISPSCIGNFRHYFIEIFQ